MDSIRSIISVSIQNVKKTMINPRFLVILFLVPSFLNLVVGPVNDFARITGYKVRPWLLVFVFSDSYVFFMLTLCLILLFCDAPFLDDFQPYVIIRIGRIKWLISQVIYIMIMSFIYLAIINLSILLLSWRTVSFGTDWGKVLNTLAQTNAAAQFQIRLNISYEIILLYTPVQAMLLSSCLFWLICVFIGLLMFVINLLTSRTFGSILALGLSLISFVTSNFSPNLLLISPVSWANIGIFHSNSISNPLSLGYCLSVLIIGILLFITILIRAIKHKDINVLPKL